VHIVSDLQHDGADNLKLNFPAAWAATVLAWGYIEFPEASRTPVPILPSVPVTCCFAVCAELVCRRVLPKSYLLSHTQTPITPCAWQRHSLPNAHVAISAGLTMLVSPGL